MRAPLVSIGVLGVEKQNKLKQDVLQDLVPAHAPAGNAVVHRVPSTACGRSRLGKC